MQDAEKIRLRQGPGVVGPSRRDPNFELSAIVAIRPLHSGGGLPAVDLQEHARDATTHSLTVLLLLEGSGLSG